MTGVERSAAAIAAAERAAASAGMHHVPRFLVGEAAGAVLAALGRMSKEAKRGQDSDAG